MMDESLRQQTRDFIIEMSDVDLAEYVTAGTTLYEPAAVEFARREFQRRNIDLNQVKIEIKARENVEAEVAAVAADLPLHVAMKFMAFLGGFFISFLVPLLFLMAASYGFNQRGETRRASEMWHFVVYGVLGALSLFALSIAIVAYSR
jgi:hypothetical protein